MTMRWGAVIAAAGRGERFGRAKQFVEIAGLPMLGWSIRAFAQMEEIAEIVVVTEQPLVSDAEELLVQLAPDRAARVVVGGATRQDSVRRGVRTLGERVEAILVHDGARPLVRPSTVRAGMQQVRPGRGAVLAAPVIDTIKEVDSATLRVKSTLERKELWAAQTPQLAMLADFVRAYEREEPATDDTTLLERVGVEVVVVPSRQANFKVTVPEDVALAEVVLRERLDRAYPDPAAMLVEVFSRLDLVDAVCRELERRGGHIDGIERDLPRGVAVRAYIEADRLRDFETSFVPLADGSATLTVHNTGGIA